MRRGKLVVFLGPVGVGKSTVCRYLVSILRRKGYTASFIYVKAVHGLSFLIFYTIALLIFGRRLHNYIRKRIAPWYIVSKRNKILAEKITAIVAAIDTLISLPLQLLRISLMLFFNDFVLCEEYLLGTINDHLYGLLKTKSVNIKWCLRAMIRILTAMALRCRPYLIIILDANYHELLSRWRNRGYGELQWEYIFFQKVFLKLLREEMIIKGVTINYIDANNGIIKVLQRALSALPLIHR